MKYLTLAFALFALFAFGQTTSTPWSGIEEVQTLSLCQTHGTDNVLCVGTDGLAYSFQGGAFQKLNLVGPQGPAGPTGATGPQGVPGPVQSFNSLKCGTSNLSNTGLSATSCAETTP